MNFKQWLNLQEKSLYHGTIVDYEDSIRKYGLQGGWHGAMGPFVQDMYGSEYSAAGIEPDEDEAVIFMTDKPEIGKAVNAMIHHISKKLNKGFHDVTATDIRNHGLLVKIIDDSDHDEWEDGYDQYDPDDMKWAYKDPPVGAEPGDYYAQSAGGDAFIRGTALMKFLKRHGELPPTPYGTTDQDFDKYERDRLIKMAIKRGIPRDKAVKTVMGASRKDAEEQLRAWSSGFVR